MRRGLVPGPRILTSMGQLSARTGGAEELAAAVERLAAAGADAIKIFASESIRVGGGPTLSQEELDAACGAANERGSGPSSTPTGRRAPPAPRAPAAPPSSTERSSIRKRWTCSPRTEPITTRTRTSSSPITSRTGTATSASGTTPRRASRRWRRAGSRHGDLRKALGTEGLRSSSGPTRSPAPTARTSAKQSPASSREARTRGELIVGLTSLAAESLDSATRSGPLRRVTPPTCRRGRGSPPRHRGPSPHPAGGDWGEIRHGSADRDRVND